MLRNIFPFIAFHPYDLRGSVVLRSQLSPAAGDANELSSVLRAVGSRIMLGTVVGSECCM